MATERREFCLREVAVWEEIAKLSDCCEMVSGSIFIGNLRNRWSF
ncbi:hypothetical protein SLEP1_g51267 [Rubroshorea leprosula]|uniref:Uncharacterized protein n=1 Tax=Rubroshorea leprosula TaxID=152421 RepID=A0AAV5M2Q0_9ROSI|nr:hypothetical protein SLEP1_g51267 [Rubroshorea leprosula]